MFRCAARHRISIDYFRTARTRLIAGRMFDQNDRQGGRHVAIVNEAFVHQLLPGENPIGKRFEHGTNGPWREVIGVVENGKYRSLSESPMPAVFEPMEQDYSPNNNLIARSSLPEGQVTAMLRRAVMDLDSSITLATQGSWTGQLGLALFPARIAAIVLGAFGVLAIVLSATGVYGVTAYGPKTELCHWSAGSGLEECYV